MDNLTLQEIQDILSDKFGKDIKDNLYVDTNKIYDGYEYRYIISNDMYISILYNCRKDEAGYIRLYQYGYCLLTIYRPYKIVIESLCSLVNKLVEESKIASHL